MPQAAPMPMPTLSKHNHEDDATLPLSPATDTLPGAGSETQDMRVLAESSPVGQCASASNHTSTAAIGGKRHIVEADIDEGLPAVDLSTLDGTSVSPVVSPPLLASTQLTDTLTLSRSPITTPPTTYKSPAAALSGSISPPFVPAAANPQRPVDIAPAPMLNSFHSMIPRGSSTEFAPSVPSTNPTVRFPDQTDEERKMFLAAAQRKRNMATTPAVTEYEADLTSKDRMKQKEAIRRILNGKVKNDWEWSAEDGVDMSVFKPQPSAKTITENGEVKEGEEDNTTWVERLDWTSELSSSEGEDETLTTISSTSPPASPRPEGRRPSLLHRLSGSISRSHHADPFRFENPDSVGEALKKRVERKKLRRQKRMNEELKVNEGLRCFTARRNVWTGAKVVKRAKVEGATSCPSSATKSANGSTEGKLESASTEVNGIESSAVDTSLDDFDNESDDDVVYDTLIPLAPPLLPPNTPMRKNITSKAYTTIYDKVILQSQTPFCPINLQTVISSCVEGWKRDGEWPPKETGPEPMLSRKKVAGEARRQKAEGVGQIGGGQAGRDSWRRSLQRVFGGKTGTADLV